MAASFEASNHADSKALAHVIARLALAGYSVHEIADGGFIACRRDMARHYPDARALSAFAKQLLGDAS